MKWRIVLAYVALMLFTLLMTNQPAVASKPSGGEGGIFVRIPTAYANEMAQLNLATAQWLDYGSFQWLEISSAELSRLQANNIPVTVDTEAGVVQITRYRFDPLAQGEPDVPAELQASGNGRGFHLVQFAGPIQTSWLEELTAAGLPMLQYYPHNTYLTWGTPTQLNALESNSAVRWHGAVHPAYKLSETLDGRDGLVRNVNLVIYNDGQLEATIKQVEDLGGQLLQTFPSQPDRAFYDAILVMDAAVLPQVAQIANVLWVGYIGDAPRLDDEMSSQIVAGNYSGAGVPFTGYNDHLADLGYDGTGVVWAIVDSGVDYDHPDLGPRIVGGHNFAGCVTTNPGDASDDGHGTHVAGIIGGDATLGFTDGSGFLYGLGVAPAYSIFAMNPICNAATSWPPAGGWQENSKQAVLGNAVGSNNSWTTSEGTQHGYQASERTHDFMVRDGNFDTAAVAEPIMTVFSAGNSGNSGITAPKEAKNIIVTASSENFRAGSINTISSFSSRGPAVDGRVGITIAAPGGEIASTMSDTGGSCTTAIGGTGNRYSFCSGTSMASPHASGALALITEWWRDINAGATPSPAMARALLVNGAVDMGTADIPNINEGWGRINVTQVISPSADVRYYDQTHLFTETGQQWPLVVGIMDPTKPAKITLTWSDAPGAVGANPALVNNLDLQVTNNGNTYLGNVFTSGWSATGGTADTRHNTENVYIQNPTGDMTIVVAATNIAGDGVPYNGDATDQDFALVCYNCALEPDFSLLATPASYETCTLTTTSVEYNITVGSIMSFTDQVDLSVLGNPAGTVDTLSDDPVTPPGSSALTIVIVGPVVAGSYDIDIIGMATTRTHTTTVGLDLYTAAPTTVTLTAPANGATDIGLAPTLTWTADANATSYDVEVATDMAFTNIVFTDTVAATSANLIGLSANTTYYWRVTPNNACGAGATSAVFSFTTAVLYCGSVGSLPDDPDQTFTLNIADAGEITDLDVSILADHTYVGDTIFTLVHQDTGTSVTMIDRPGRTTTGFGCANNNIDVLLSDEGGDGPVENQCAADPALFGSPTPNNPLSAFDGEDLSGTWLLQYTDAAGGDIGTLNEWCLMPTLAPVVPNYGVQLPADSAQTELPSTTVTYTVYITNTGNTSDTFDLTVAGNSWSTQTSVADIELMAGEMGSFEVTVDIPAGALGGEVDMASVTATSQGDNAESDTVNLITTAEPVHDLEWSVDTTTHTGAAGETVTYTFMLTNTGNTTDTYNITLAGHAWSTAASPTSLMLERGEMDSFTVAVQVDAGAQPPDSDTVTVTATSQGDNGVAESVNLTTTAEAVYGFDWSADTTAHTGAAGETVTYTISLTNTGNTTDTFNIALAGHSWTTTASDSSLMLAPGQSADFTVSVTIDAGAVHPATDIVTVTATSAGDGNVTDNVALTTAVEEVIVPATPVIYLPLVMKP